MSDPSISKEKPGVQLNRMLEDAGLEPTTYQYRKLPWRGKAQWIDERRADWQPVEDTRMHLTIIDTTVPDDRARYEAITTLISRGAAFLIGEEVQTTETENGKGWLLMVRWMDRFYRSPDPYEAYWQKED